ncbi:cyclic nucleotide-binding domain-containing protein [Rhodovibrionaceae bacterium A322]
MTNGFSRRFLNEGAAASPSAPSRLQAFPLWLLIAPLITGLGLLLAGTAQAHERWILTPEEINRWSAEPRLELMANVTATNLVVLAVALVLALLLYKLNQRGAAEFFPDLRARLEAKAHYSSLVLRFCLAWTLLGAALALETHAAIGFLERPTFLAPDLFIDQLPARWQWFQEAQIAIAVFLLLGWYVRLQAAACLALCTLALFVIGEPMLAYYPSMAGVCLYLIFQGPGTFFLPLPLPAFLRTTVDQLSQLPRPQVQVILRVFTGLNLLFLGVFFKLMQPNLVYGIILDHDVPILDLAPQFFVLLMTIVEICAGTFLILGVLMRPIAVVLLLAFLFFSSVLEETFTAHMLYYGIMVTFLFNGGGQWRRPKPKDKAANIIILGDGFAALAAAMRIAELKGAVSNINLTLVAQQSDLIYRPLLPEVFSGGIQPGGLVNSLRRLLPGVRVLQAELNSVDPAEKTVTLTTLSGQERTLPYDQLISAQERQPNLDNLPGLLQHSHPLHTIGDALYLKKLVLTRLAAAEMLPSDDPHRQALLTFAVIGSNQTAAGTALELRRLLNTAWQAYPGLLPRDFIIHQLDAPSEADPLPDSSLIIARNKLLKKAHITQHRQATIEALTPEGIKLEGQEDILCQTIINCRLQQPELPLTLDNKNQPLSEIRHATARQLCDDGLFPDLQQFNQLGADHGYNAWAESQGYDLKPLDPHRHWFGIFHMGQSSIASFGPLVYGGPLAWLQCRVAYLAQLPGLEKNLRVALNWLLDLVFANDIVTLAPDRSDPLLQSNYAKGDLIIRQGETGDSAYFIQSGEVAVEVDGKELARLGKGQCFGELALLTGAPRAADIRCLTPVLVTCLARRQFQELAGGFTLFKQAMERQADSYKDNDT